MLLRTALACCALVACKGSERSEDQRAPAQAPIAPPVVADAAPPDAPGAKCFAVPFDASAEQAGIRRLAHDARQPLPLLRERVKGVTKLASGVPTRVPGLKPSKEGEPLRVPDLGADALVTMAKIKGTQVELTAPPHLSGAVFEITGQTSALVAVGDLGLVTLVRYRNDYVKARIAKAPKTGADAVDGVEPIAVFYADLDGDGIAELISYSVVFSPSPSPPPGRSGLAMLRASVMELGVLWKSGEIAFARMCCETTPFALFLAPPTLSGGRPLVFALNGDRFAVDPKGITALLRVSPSGALCLQTSATEPAQLIVKP